jgi:hypothetical protein
MRWQSSAAILEYRPFSIAVGPDLSRIRFAAMPGQAPLRRRIVVARGLLRHGRPGQERKRAFETEKKATAWHR